VGETGGLRRDALEYVVHETVHDAHRFARNPRVRVHLFQHFVYVDGVALLPPALLLLVSLGDVLLRLSRLLRRFAARFGRHFRRRDAHEVLRHLGRSAVYGEYTFKIFSKNIPRVLTYILRACCPSCIRAQYDGARDARTPAPPPRAADDRERNT